MNDFWNEMIRYIACVIAGILAGIGGVNPFLAISVTIFAIVLMPRDLVYTRNRRIEDRLDDLIRLQRRNGS